jgi:hypothetical protein
MNNYTSEQISRAIVGFKPGDKINLNTGYACDKGTVIRMDGDNVVWEAVLGGVYSSPVANYNITVEAGLATLEGGKGC